MLANNGVKNYLSYDTLMVFKPMLECTYISLKVLKRKFDSLDYHILENIIDLNDQNKLSNYAIQTLKTIGETTVGVMAESGKQLVKNSKIDEYKRQKAKMNLKDLENMVHNSGSVMNQLFGSTDKDVALYLIECESNKYKRCHEIHKKIEVSSFKEVELEYYDLIKFIHSKIEGKGRVILTDEQVDRFAASYIAAKKVMTRSDVEFDINQRLSFKSMYSKKSIDKAHKNPNMVYPNYKEYKKECEALFFNIIRGGLLLECFDIKFIENILMNDFIKMRDACNMEIQMY